MKTTRAKRRRVTVPLKAKVLYVKGRPELWSNLRELARQMMLLGFYARSTSPSDVRKSMPGLVRRARG